VKNNIFYRIWYWIGCQCWFFREYNIQRDESMKKARMALEEAFSPKLKKMLEGSSTGYGKK